MNDEFPRRRHEKLTAFGRLSRWLLLPIWLFFLSASFGSEEGQRAVIDDQDGITNIRAAASKQSGIIDRVPEGEEFTVYPSDRTWWGVRTKRGKEGYIHRSCVRIVPAPAETEQSAEGPLTVSRDAATLAAWAKLIDVQERSRLHQLNETSQINRELQAISLDGVDPVVERHLSAEIASNVRLMAISRQIKTAVGRVQPAITARELLRPAARELGASLMPGAWGSEQLRQEAGQAIGDLLLLYVFSDATAARDLPDMTRQGMDRDRLTVEESVIHHALGLEPPPGMKAALGNVRDRAYAARLQSGRWILRDANGSVADLKMRTDPKAAWNACGWVNMHWRDRRRSNLSFQYEFAQDGSFRLYDTGMGAAVMGIPLKPQICQAVFVQPTILKVTDQNGRSMGTWERVSD